MRKQLLATSTIVIISILAGLFAVFGGHSAPAEGATAAAYGAGAYTGSNPIGGGSGYVSPHGYSQATADYVVRTVSELTSALSSSSSGDVIWIPDGVTINVGSSAYGKTLKSGVALASNRGQNGAAGGKIKSSYDTSAFMPGVIVAQSNTVISGLTFEGVRGLGSVGPCGQCAILGNYAKNVEVENCEIFNFPGGGVYFYHDPNITVWNDDNQRNWVHHCYIHNIQRHGYGYGVGVQGGSQSVLVEACYFNQNRHSVMNAGGEPSYEVRYCIFGDSIYNTSNTGTGTWYGSHQVDSHGGGYYGFKAGTHLYIHHNTFSVNAPYAAKPNIAIRGVVSSECRVEYNWTKKTPGNKSSPPEFAETGINAWASIFGEEGGPWDGPSSTLASAHVYVTHNWYGASAPPNGTVANHAPVLAAIGSKSAAAGSTISFTISASDMDGDALTFSASNLPSGAAFNTSSRTFSWTPGQAGTFSAVRFQVSDGSASDYEDITITVTSTSSVDPDINADGKVNSLDMVRVGQRWGQSGAPGWVPEDINHDGTISVLDATIIGQNWTG